MRPPLVGRPSRSPAVRAAPEARPAAGAALHRLSFRDLAVATTLPLFDQAMAGFGRLDETLQPHDPALKAFRRDLQALRDHLDLFAFAFSGDGKRWSRLRRAIDHGYERIGRFKDLFESQGLEVDSKGRPPPGTRYDPEPAAKLLRKVLSWARGFEREGRVDRWRAMIASPPQLAHPVEPAKLSRFFWGAVSFRPSPDAPGVEVLERLSGALTDAAAADVERLSRFEVLPPGDGEEAFHDARKRLRTIFNLMRYLPGPRPERLKGLLRTLDAAVVRYGGIEDRFAARELARKAGNAGRVQELDQRIAHDWSALRRWQAQHRLLDTLRQLRASLQATTKPPTTS